VTATAREGGRLDIPRPRILWADRGDPDGVSAGDEACVSLAPGLLQFLETDLGGGLTPGAGFEPRWILPPAAAVSACYYLASPRGRETLNSWMATRSDFTWERAGAVGETLEARARIVRIGRASIRFHWRVESAAGHDVLARGDLVLVSRGPSGTVPPVFRLRDAGAAPAPPSDAPPAPGPARELPGGPAAARVRGLAGRLRRCYQGWRAVRGRPAAAPMLEATPADIVLAPGQSATVTVHVGAVAAGSDAELLAELPAGHGLAFRWIGDPCLRPPHRAARAVCGEVTALRPDEVNLGRPWVLRLCVAAGGQRLCTADVRVAVPDAAPAEVYYVPAAACGAAARAGCTSAEDLCGAARALAASSRIDALWSADGPLPAGPEERQCAFERRLAECSGAGVRIVRDGAHDDDAHLRYVRAVHPRVRIAGPSEALLAFLDYYTPRALAVVLPATHRRGDGGAWRHPVRILGRGIPITPDAPQRLRLETPWWGPGEVREMALLREGTVIARREPARDERPAIEFLAAGHSGHELLVAVHETPAPAACAAEGGSPIAGERFVEWPHDPAVLLAGFEAPFELHAWRARADGAGAGDRWSWVFPAAALRLLYSPLAGGTEPLGRRAHPLGAMAAAATVHVARSVLGGGWRPRGAGVRWRHPIDPQAGFLLHLHVRRSEAARIDVESRLEQPPVRVAEVTLTLCEAGA
jgi:hypothetical protein